MTKVKKYTPPVRIPKWVKIVAKVLEWVSPALAVRFAIQLFTTPIRFKTPKRELKMAAESRQERVYINAILKTINVYRLGNSNKKVLLVHGWSGRGTQLSAIAHNFVERGFETISFDAPAHGKSSGKTSDMTEFIASIMQLEQQFGPFEYAVGHSLGAMATLNSIKNGLDIKKAVIIGSGDIIEDIMLGFTTQLGMKIATGRLMMAQFEKKFGQTVNSYSAYIAAQSVYIPVLVFHDENDRDVHISAAHHIHIHLPNGELVITQGQGHRKILGNKEVIRKINDFLV
ncbi:alpha/beta hydrolase [Flavobacterium akiainvivens]|uniref:Alpha/beta hydrolase n=1 Tax=Flavobacterium akiainvivens TaxID=1202724 RepID=A0A0M8MKY9_9FLAO|nr:alpha/beta hydrolase [Flavobacterium akiainvivens]KOS07957.1 alpha/beta hydrolase [Flavobacterium akiainvivens]SFQ61166.1 Pimeloyl-ACP methyl ester carboxylesterase [Flavobacterium akiainvivens]